MIVVIEEPDKTVKICFKIGFFASKLAYLMFLDEVYKIFPNASENMSVNDSVTMKKWWQNNEHSEYLLKYLTSFKFEVRTIQIYYF